MVFFPGELRNSIDIDELYRSGFISEEEYLRRKEALNNMNLSMEDFDFDIFNESAATPAGFSNFRISEDGTILEPIWGNELFDGFDAQGNPKQASQKTIILPPVIPVEFNAQNSNNQDFSIAPLQQNQFIRRSAENKDIQMMDCDDEEYIPDDEQKFLQNNRPITPNILNNNNVNSIIPNTSNLFSNNPQQSLFNSAQQPTFFQIPQHNQLSVKSTPSFPINVNIYDVEKTSAFPKKPYKCNVVGCKKTFESKSTAYYKHVRVHTGEKPFACTEPGCNKRFSHRATLKEHQNIHAGAKPYVCKHPGCGKSFANSSNLSRHVRIHTGEKPYKCPHCSKAFSQSGNLKQHVSSVHGKHINIEDLKR